MLLHRKLFPSVSWPASGALKKRKIEEKGNNGRCFSKEKKEYFKDLITEHIT
jgi:hypothetical protein